MSLPGLRCRLSHPFRRTSKEKWACFRLLPQHEPSSDFHLFLASRPCVSSLARAEDPVFFRTSSLNDTFGAFWLQSSPNTVIFGSFANCYHSCWSIRPSRCPKTSFTSLLVPTPQKVAWIARIECSSFESTDAPSISLIRPFHVQD